MRTVLEADEGSSICSITAKSDTPNIEFVSIHVKSVVHMMREGTHCIEKQISANRQNNADKEKLVTLE
jgi:hypothetical protein